MLGNLTPTELGRTPLGLTPDTGPLYITELREHSVGQMPLSVEEESVPLGKGKAQEFWVLDTPRLGEVLRS